MNKTNEQKIYFAIIQTGVCVWGVGKSIDDAVNDANEWLSPNDQITADDIGDDCAIEECTQALYDYVNDYGGDFNPEKNQDGYLDLPERLKA